MGRYVKLAVFSPASHAEKIRRALAKSGCGHIGKYDSCSFSIRGVGRFRPLKGANPYLGKKGKLGKVSEERIETICLRTKLKGLLKKIKKIHPYEEPAVDIYPLLNAGQL